MVVFDRLEAEMVHFYQLGERLWVKRLWLVSAT